MNQRFTFYAHTRRNGRPHDEGRVSGGLHPVFPVLMLTLTLMLNACTEQRGYQQLTGYAQGGTWSVKYNATGIKARPAEVQRGIEAILNEIDTTLSGYNKGSQLSRLNAGDTIRPGRMLLEMYDYGYALWEETGGAVDVAAGPLFDIWGFGFKNDSRPSADKVRATMAVSGMRRLVPTMEEALSADGRLHRSRLLRGGGGDSSLTLRMTGSGTGPGMTGNDAGPVLNFNAVAQGYSCDTVARYLNSLGIKDMLVDIGEIWCSGANPGGRPWRVGVDRPKDGNNTPGADLDGIWESAGGAGRSGGDHEADREPALRPGKGQSLAGEGIVTSGNYRKFYMKDGRKISHTIDPRTGYPAENSLLSATVTAPTAAAADAYATYCMVIGYNAAKEFIEGRAEVEGYLIFATPDGSMAEWSSAGFRLVSR